jgi:ankyrin repeat protein
LENFSDDESKRKSFLHQKTRNGFTALHISVYKVFFQFIIKLRVLINKLKGEKNVTMALLEAGTDPCFLSPNVPPPLHLAAMAGNIEVIQAMVKHCSNNLHAQDFVQYTALHCATYFGHEQVARELLTAGADPNFCGGVHDSPLHIAAGKANPAILKALLEAGADRMIFSGF